MKKIISIKTNDKESMYDVLENIHEQLKGNQDYIDCNIILNDSSTRHDNTENEVRIYIKDEVKNIPKIIL